MIIEFATISFIHLLLLITTIKCVGGFFSCLRLLTVNQKHKVSLEASTGRGRGTRPVPSEKPSYCHFEKYIPRVFKFLQSYSKSLHHHKHGLERNTHPEQSEKLYCIQKKQCLLLHCV